MYDQELAFAVELAKKAGDIMRKHSSAGIIVEKKQDNSPVTIADKTINDLVIAQVEEHFSDHSVLGEEASVIKAGPYAWSCDPIDGTVAYIHRFPTSMFSLALLKDGSPVVAVAYNPWIDELYSAQHGGGAFLNGKKTSVSNNDIFNSTLATAATLSEDKIDKIKRLRDGVPPQTHINGVVGAVFPAMRIAAGDIEGYIFYYSGAHDVSASKLIIEEAGGRVTDIDGNEQRYDQPINGAIMSNGIIHEDLLRTL